MDRSRAFTPNERVTPRLEVIVLFVWCVLGLSLWAGRSPIFPSPWEVLGALPGLWTQEGLGQELIASLTASVTALALAVGVSLPLAYLSRVPALRPLAQGVAGLRFLSPASFFVILLFVVPGHVKVVMLAMGTSFFLTLAMMDIVEAVPDERYDDCRTLRMTEWQCLWYAVVRGTWDQALVAIRDTAAMTWMMLPMVEGIVRSEGGVGVLMLNQEKHLNFPEVYAVALVIILAGLAQDYALGVVRRLMCPWSVR